jgi:hypothetical protein
MAHPSVMLVVVGHAEHEILDEYRMFQCTGNSVCSQRCVSINDTHEQCDLCMRDT